MLEMLSMALYRNVNDWIMLMMNERSGSSFANYTKKGMA